MSASWAAKGRLLRQDAAAAPRGGRAARANGASISANGTPRHRASLPKQRGGLARGRGAGAYDVCSKQFEVELAVGDANQAAGRPRDDQVAAERWRMRSSMRLFALL